MSKSNYDTILHQLIQVLSKAEKRFFKLHYQNHSNEADYQFIHLFDLIDKGQLYQKKAVEKVLPGITNKQLSGLKRHLYQKLLDSLRIYNSKTGTYQLTHQIETAKVLYSKGLFLESLKILNKVKQKALTMQQHIIAYEVIGFEKDIESRHVTRSHSMRAEELEIESDQLRLIIRSETDWSQFALKLYAKYLKMGHIKSESEQDEIKSYFEQEKPAVRTNTSLLFYESLYQFQAYNWYHYIQLNFKLGFRYCVKWIKLFDQFPEFEKSHPHLLIKGYHNCLSVLYSCMDPVRHELYLNTLLRFCNQNQSNFDQNTKSISFIYLNNARLNDIILSGKFSKSKSYLIAFESELETLTVKIDDYRLMVFLYKMASIYFTMGDFSNCNRLLNRIINTNQNKLREDIQCFARLLNIIAHFELKNDEFLVYQIKSTYRFLMKMNEVMKIHTILIRFLKTSLFTDRENITEQLIYLKHQLEQLSKDPYENRSFLYLDFISWLESKIENESVERIIFMKRQQLLKAYKNG